MPSSFVFTGAGLFVLDASPSGVSRIRVRFSRPPLRSNPANLNDSLRAANYTLTGSLAVTVTSVLPLSDTQSVELVTSSPLPYGVWTVTVANVQAIGGGSLVAPTSASFNVAQQQTSITAGTEDEGDAYNVIRKHLNAALDGSNWRALIAALADADNYVWNLARSAFDQLFLSTASGKYLDRLAANDGNRRPSGMSDDAFRPLATELATGRVTYLSILSILEAFYGKEALRAYIDTDDAPFSMVDGDTIDFVFEGREFQYVANEDEFRSIGDATASELAVSLSRFFEQNKLEAVAGVLVNPATGEEFVRIYSEVLGLRSSVSAVSSASLGFPSGVQTVYNGSRTVAVSQTTDGVLEVSVPVTADTQRNSGNAGYVVGNEPVGIVNVHRLDSGVAEVVTDGPHGLTSGRQVEIAGFHPSSARAYVPQYSPAVDVFGETHQQSLFSTGSAANQSPSLPAVAPLSDGSLVVVGGVHSGAYSSVTHLITPTRTTISDDSPASGSTRFDYVLTTLSPGLQRYAAQATTLTGALLDQIVVTGGWQPTGSKPTNSVQRLTSGTWSTTNSLLDVRAAHRQVELPSGQLFVMGGMTNTSAATINNYPTTRSLNTCEIYNPAADEWLYASPMLTPRGDFGATVLNNGKILASGGYVMGQQTHPNMPGLKAYWLFDVETGGDDVAGAGAPHDLTIDPAEIYRHSKVGSGSLLCGGASTFAYRASDATLTSIFDLTYATGEMTFEIWVSPWLHATEDQNLVVVQNPAQAHPSPFQLFVTPTGSVKFSYYDGVNPADVITPLETPAGVLENGKWAHICVVGVDVGSGNATHTVYVNGVELAQATNLMPVSNGSVRLNIGFAPAAIGTNVNYDELVDDVKLWTRALGEYEIRRQYLAGAGQYTPDASTPFQFGLVRQATNKAELYNINVGSWTATKNMNVNRAGHASLLLDTGEVFVIGGEGGNNPDYLHALSSTEIFDPAAEEWRLGPSLPLPLASAWAVKAGSFVYCGGTSDGAFDSAGNTITDERRYVFWIDTRKMDSWNTLPDTLRLDSALTGYAHPDGDWLLLSGSYSYDRFEIVAPLQKTVSSSGGINGFHRVNVTSPTTFTIETPSTAKYTSMYGAGYRGVVDDVLNSELVLLDPSVLIQPSQYISGVYNVSKTGGVATVTAAIPAGTEYVWIGTTSSGFTSGIKAVVSITSTEFTYAESAGTASGSVWVGLATSTPESEASEATGEFGTYIINTTTPTIRSISSPLASALESGSSYTSLPVSSTARFPDGAGYVVLGYGTQYETAPVRYLEAISSTELLLDRTLAPAATIPAGTEVALVDLTPSQDITNSLWVTGSILAMLAARQNVEESVANDVELQFNVIYPDDRGLGGEGSSHSDKYVVWGPDTAEDPE